MASWNEEKFLIPKVQKLFEQGQYEENLKNYREVLKMQKVKLGDHHRDTLKTETDIGRTLLLKGKKDEALKIINKTFEAQKSSISEHPDFFGTYNSIASILIQNQDYEEALGILRKILEVAEKEGFDSLGFRHTIATVLHELGRYQEALNGYREVLGIFKERFGQDHPVTLKIGSTIGKLFSDLGKYQEAQEIYEVQKRTLGLNDPSTLITRNNMACMLWELGRKSEALDIFQEVHRYRIEVLGVEDPETIKSRTRINRIALNLFENGKPEEALRLLTEICEHMPEAASSRADYITMQYDIAYILKVLERYEDSSKIFKKVYEKRVDVLGPNDEKTLDALYQIAELLKDMGKYSEALDSLRKVAEKQISVLGSEHESVLHTKNTLSQLLTIMGNDAEASEIFHETYEIQKRKRPEHPETLQMETVVAQNLSESGKYTEALDMLYKTLSKQKNAGSSEFHLLHTKSLIALCLDKKGRYDEALTIYGEIYETRTRLLGSEHPDTLQALHSKGSILASVGNLRVALELLNEVFEKRKKILGKEHLSTLRTQHNVAAVFSKLGRHLEALEMHQEVLEIFQKTSPNNSDINLTKKEMAEELIILNEYDKAMHILTEIIENTKSDPLQPDFLTVRNCIAKVLSKQEKYSEAIDILEDVIKKSTEIHGSEHLDTLNARCILGGVLLDQKKYEEALKIYEDIYDIVEMQRVLDLIEPDEKHPAYPFSLNVKNNIATVYCCLGRFDEALEMYKKVYKETKKRVGPGNNTSGLMKTKQNIASVLERQKKYSEALPLFYDVYRKGVKSLGRSHPLSLLWLKSSERIESLVPKSNLFVAVLKNDLDEVRNLIDRGYDINTRDALGMSLLHVATENGNIEMMKLLLEKGAFYNITDEEGHTPLFFALAEECEKLLSSIEEAFQAVKKVNIDNVRSYVESGCIVNVRDNAGSTLLHWACNGNDVNIVEYLLSKGTDPTLVTKKGNTPLHIACSKRNFNVVVALIRHVEEKYPAKMADFVNGRTAVKGTTSLHVAAKNGDVEIIKLLIDNGADLKVKNGHGKMPIDLAPKNIFDLLNGVASPNNSTALT